MSGLRQLGLREGDKVLVHSSLSALGRVEGGADTVIDALLETVGPDGLVAVPTFGCEPPFDRRTSATPFGAIADRFWRRATAVRSLHPTHSVAAIGCGAEELVRDHEKAPTAYAEGTPYCKLAMSGGKILMLGVDQDRNTTLHAAEALVGAAYLRMGRLDEAREAINRLLALDPDSAPGLLLLSKCFARVGADELAADALARSVSYGNEDILKSALEDPDLMTIAAKLKMGEV